MAKIKPNDGEIFRFQGDEWEPVESFGSGPPTANMDEAIVAVGDEQMEAAGGDCPVIVLFDPKSRFAAVIHISADRIQDDHHKVLVNAVLDRFKFPAKTKAYVLMDLEGPGKVPAEREEWLDRICDHLKSRKLKAIEKFTDGQGKTVVLDALEGNLRVEDDNGNTVLDYSYE
jgi:hypothetical protein